MNTTMLSYAEAHRALIEEAVVALHSYRYEDCMRMLHRSLGISGHLVERMEVILGVDQPAKTETPPGGKRRSFGLDLDN